MALRAAARLIIWGLCASGCVWARGALAATYTVTNTSNSGAGSLRQAITDANSNAGADTIEFNIPGGGVQTISPTSALPTITGAVTIDGYTQPGSSVNTLTTGNNAVLTVVINGINAGSTTHGLRITAGSCTIRGLVINNFSYSGIRLNTGGGNVIVGNFIGTNSTGTTAVPNGRGTMWDGIVIGDTAASGSNTIGGTTAADRNVISGNNGGGIWMVASSGSNTIRNNYIGVNAAGTAAIANGQYGIILAGPSNTIIGNVISGNGSGSYHGIYLPTGTDSATIQGNIIGLNAAGTAAIPNTDEGINVESNNVVIGGTTAGAGNVISGNTGSGIYTGNCSGAVIQGNIIGLNAAGTAAIRNNGDGMSIVNCTSFTIGGTSSSARNVISGNNNSAVWADGIWLSGGSGHVVQGNYLGVGSNGVSVLPNYHSGVAIAGSTSNTIGGTAGGAGNVIVGNTLDGIVLDSSSTQNAMLGNAISGNGNIPIDLNDNGISMNDGLKLGGTANNGMDFPVITKACLSSTTLTVAGYVGSAQNQSLFASARVEIFKAANDAGGYGGSTALLGALTADANGAFSGQLAVSGLTAGDKVTAIATDTSNNSSEFGLSVVVGSCLTITSWRLVNPNP